MRGEWNCLSHASYVHRVSLCMGLLSILQKNKCKWHAHSYSLADKDRELRILFLGLDNAGKTTTLKRLLGEPINTVSPTFGFAIRSLVRNGYAN